MVRWREGWRSSGKERHGCRDVCIDTNGTGQLIGDLAAVLEKYEDSSSPLIQLLEHKMAVNGESKISGLFNFRCVRRRV